MSRKPGLTTLAGIASAETAMFTRPVIALALVLSAACATAQTESKPAPQRDPFYWLGEINKATLVINTDQGLLDRSKAPRLAAGLAKVLEAGAQPAPGGRRR